MLNIAFTTDNLQVIEHYQVRCTERVHQGVDKVGFWKAEAQMCSEWLTAYFVASIPSLETVVELITDTEEISYEVQQEVMAGCYNGTPDDEVAAIFERLHDQGEMFGSVARQLSQLGARIHHYGSFRSYQATGDEWGW